MIFKPVTTEKAVKLIDVENTLMFMVDRRADKDRIKKEFEKLFEVKIDSVRTMSRKNRKLAYIRLNKKSPAANIAAKLGVI